MATLTNTKIKDTYPALLKATDNGQLSATEKVITDGVGNNSTLSLGTNSASVAGTLAFGSLKDSGENITITKFVDEADGIAANDNDTTIPTSAAVKNYVDNAIPTEADTLATVTARGSSTNTAITVQGLRLSTGANTAGIVLGNPTALLDNTTGESNIAIGEFGTLADNTSGNNNIGLGSSSLRFNTTGNNNTAIGISALTNNTTGSFNTAIGSSALRNINGSGNFAMGYNAGANIDALPSEKTGGSDNIYIGSESKSGAISTDNEIVIGASAIGNGSNTATYGNASIVEHHFTAGDVYMNNDLFGVDVIGNSFGATEYIRIGAGDVRLGVGGTDRVIVDSSGNVRIGTSASTSSRLNVTSSSAIDDVIRWTDAVSDTGYLGIDGSGGVKLWAGGFLSFGAGGGGSFTERMRIDSSGVVQVRNQTPTIQLYNTDTSVATSQELGSIDFYTSDISAARVSSYMKSIFDSAFGASYLTFGTSTGVSAPTERMRITSGGDVGIGTTPASGVRLHVSGGVIRNVDTYNNTTASFANMVVSAGGTFERSISSIKYKKDVVDYDKGLDVIDTLRPVYYKGKSVSDGDKQFAGLIAEEVHEAGLVEFVQYAEDGSPDALAYTHLTALLIKGIQELRAEVELLKSQLS